MRRLKVAIVAFACVPHAGSEQGGGWAWARAAAEKHDVWLFTDEANRGPIEEALRAEPDLNLQAVYVPQTRVVRAHPYEPMLIRLRYLLWLRQVRPSIAASDRTVRFDLVHHVTYSNDWLPPAIGSRMTTPLVWGPLGGAPPFSVTAARWLGAHGTVVEFARSAATTASRSLFGRRAARRAAVVLAQNPGLADRLPKGVKAIVEPQLAICSTEIDVAHANSPPRSATLPSARRTAVLAGRLLPWKGAAIAIEAMKDPCVDAWELVIYGDGYDRPRLERKVGRCGLGDRITFKGDRPRAEVLEALCGADVLLMPSIADAAGWIVAEAITVGCPVVCVQRGGPPFLIADGGGEAVPLRRDTPKRVAQAMTRCGPHRSPSLRWTADRLPAVLDRAYGLAVGPLDAAHGHVDARR